MRNIHLRQDKEKLHGVVVHAVQEFWFSIKGLLRKQFNKNIYTRILFFNVTIFVISLIVTMIFSSFVVKQVTYNQLQQDLLRKARRLNLALLQLTDQIWMAPAGVSEQVRIDLKSAQEDWEKAQSLFRIRAISKIEYDNAKAVYQRAAAAYQRETDLQQNQAKQDRLKFLTDLFNARRVTVFSKTGNIIGSSTEQEVASGSKVEERFIEALNRGEVVVTRAMDRETRRPIFITVIPMGNNQNAVENGILLEMKPPNLDLDLSRMHLYLAIGGMVILIVIIFNSVYLAMSISRPIFRLATTTAEISRGCDVLSVEDQPLEEIKALTGQLNKLAVRLQKIETESSRMEEERARLFTEISHELRTPLTSVQGFVEAIRDGMVQDKVLLKRYLDTIYTQTVHITRLVDDILALGRLESGSITVEKQPLDIIALAQSVVASFEAEANSRNTVLLLEKKTENAIIIGDIDRMEQIIRNLLKNAIKATDDGVIRVCIDVQGDEVLLTIEDNGIGIATEDLPHIWDRFYRVKNQRGSLMGENGSGLGLVIVKKLVRLQGGNIFVESQLGRGTTFSISFPSFDQGCGNG